MATRRAPHPEAKNVRARRPRQAAGGASPRPSGGGQARTLPQQPPPVGQVQPSRPPPAGQAPPRKRRAAPPRRRRRRAGRRTLHYLLLLILIVPAGAVLILTVLFQIEDITVTGLDRYHPDDIITASGIELGENLLRLNTGRIESEVLEAFTYLSSVQVSRRLPHSVEIAVRQYRPEFAAEHEDGLALLTMQGKALEFGLTRSPGLPIVRGLALEDYQPGDMINGPDSPGNAERLVMLRYLFDAAAATDFLPITNIDVRDRLNMRVVHESRLVLELGSEADMEYKLTFLNHVIVNEIEPDAQARLDISNARERRLVRRDGRVIDGEFISGDLALQFAFQAPATQDTDYYDE